MIATDYTKLFAANVTAATITDPTPTLTAPTGDGVFSTVANANTRSAFSDVCLTFYGVGTAGQTFTAAVYLWRRIGTLWIPTRAAPTLALTLGSVTGLAGAEVLDTERFANKVDQPPFPTRLENDVDFRPTWNEMSGTLLLMNVPTHGCERVEVRLATGTATSVNALAAGAD
jgi:hypothetical protein